MVANSATSSPTPDPRRPDAPRHDHACACGSPCATGCGVGGSTSAPDSSCPSSPIPNSSPRHSAPSAASGSSTPSLRHSVTASLFPAFIAANYNISALLADPRFTADEVMAFLSDPETQSRLTEIAKVAHLGLTIRAAEARHTAINVLEQVAKESEDLVEKRRAGSALFRATASPLIPPPGSARASRSTGSSATDPPRVSALPPAPPPRDVPRPDIAPLDIVKLVSQSLLLSRHNSPEPGTGLATLNAFLTPDALVCGVQLPETPDSDASPSPSSPESHSSPWPSVALSGESSSPSPSSPLRNSALSATSAFSSPSLAARRIQALKATPIGEIDGHCWCMSYSRDEIGQTLLKSPAWYVPRAGGTVDFTFTLETKLFHFPDADPDAWYITRIDSYDPFSHRRAQEQREREQREQQTRAHPPPAGPHPTPHPNNKPAKPP